MADEPKLRSPIIQFLKHLLCDVWLDIVLEKNWALSIDQCQVQALQFSVHLIDLLSILLRCNGFTGIQKAVVDHSSSRSPNSDHDLFLLQVWLNDPDNHDDVITHLEPDILESEVKWVLGSITTNEANESVEIPAELFQILKDDVVKLLHSICQEIWKTQQCHRTGKDQFSFLSQRKATPNSVQTTAQLHSSHTLAK